MDRRFPGTITLLLLALLAAPPAFATATINVIASFSIIEDLVKRVAGSDVRIVTIVPPGEDVHRWELTPPNVLALEEADIVFYNGYELEPWLRHVQAMADETLTLTALAENAAMSPLTIPMGQYKGNPDPHMWMDPKGAAAYLDVIAETLSEHYPSKADAFQQRATEAREALLALDQQVRERLQGIPQTNRTLITSEASMGYFARTYEFEYNAIWGLNSETQGSASAMESMSRQLAEQRPPALFYESTAPDIHMDALARESGLALAGPLYTDTLSEADGPAYNYPALLLHNAELLHEALGGARADH